VTVAVFFRPKGFFRGLISARRLLDPIKLIATSFLISSVTSEMAHWSVLLMKTFRQNFGKIGGPGHSKNVNGCGIETGPQRSSGSPQLNEDSRIDFPSFVQAL
jgi:hypothetical protein